jgi:hypothetical protein
VVATAASPSRGHGTLERLILRVRHRGSFHQPGPHQNAVAVATPDGDKARRGRATDEPARGVKAHDAGRMVDEDGGH